MSRFCISTGETQLKIGNFFSLMSNGMTKRVMFDIMACKWLLKYQINFPLFIVSDLWKFQMSGFFIGIGETVQKSHSDNLKLSENSELPVR